MYKIMLLLLMISAAFLLFIAISIRDRGNPMVGRWEISPSTIDQLNSVALEQGTMFHAGPAPFTFDGQYVGRMFWSQREAPADQFLRLKSKFEGNTLYFLHPGYEWIPLAVYDEEVGSFLIRQEVENKVIIWRFVRKSIEEEYYKTPPFVYSRPGKN